MKPLQRPFPRTWWLKRLPYFLFMVRELTSVFVAAYCIFLLVLIYNLGGGEEVTDLLTSPVSLLFHVVALPFVIYHAVTWFNLTPKILILRVGEERISPALIAATFYVAWIAISIFLAWSLITI